MTSISIQRDLERSAVQGDQISIYTASFGLSLGLTSLFNALLVIVKETNEHTVLAWMKTTGHHWVAHGVLDIVVFVALGLLLVPVGKVWCSHPDRVTATVIGGIIVGSLLIAGFYIRAA
jgi:uncharacterized membrane protein YkvI